MKTTSNAAENGRLCAVDKRPLDQCNPYRTGTRQHDEFVRAYRIEQGDQDGGEG